MRKNKTVLVTIILGSVLAVFAWYSSSSAEPSLTYDNLRKQGIVSGFGIRRGHPLQHVNRIPAIEKPSYIEAEQGVYPASELCIGTETDKGWRFSPIYILNSHEIVNLDNSASLCFCPLAGLAVAVPDKIVISGLLKYDTFVLYRKRDKTLILPFTQEVLGKPEEFLSFQGVQMLTYEGILKYFPKAWILDPDVHRGRRGTYGSYPKNDRMGIGHPKPGLKKAYDPKKEGYHPKERVLVIGLEGKLVKAYPFSGLKKKVPLNGGSFDDIVNNVKVAVHYYPQYKWAYVRNEEDRLLNMAYSYIFALKQHLPDIELAD